MVDAQSNRTAFAYDAGNRLTGITYPDSTTVSFAYDTRGRRTSVTDQNGKVTSYAYDDADRLTSVTDAALNVTHYAYDLENNLLSITDAAGHTTSFVYDAFGRVTQTAFPSSLTENYVYDAIGNLTSKTDRKNQTILYVYDALNRLSHKGYPDATGVDYVYDLAGKIKQVTDPTGSYGFAYDNMGRLVGTTTQYAFLPGNTYTNAYGYDAASNRTRFTAPDGSTNTYAYDTLNRLSTLTDSGAGQFTMGYDGLSRRTQLTRPNGITTSYTYDPVSHLQSILHKLGVNTLDGAAYGYDLAGNRTSKTNQLNSTTSNYGYDNIYQLTGVTQGPTSTEAYTFDPVGNRLSSLSVPSYTYNNSNEVTAAGSSSSYTYDNNGNTLTKTDGSGTVAYTWDFENRLTSVHPPGQTTVTFKYDPFGRRIQKTGSIYVYEGPNLREEADATGSLVARYVFGAGIDEPLAAYRGGTWEFYQADGLGAIRSLTTIAGTVSDSFVYDSFGDMTSSTGSFSQPFRFTGREWDAETGLYYYRARYYDSTIGRFISEDPTGFDGGINFYSYVGNDPVDDSDPSGLKKKPHKKPKPRPPCDAIFPHDPTTARLAQLVYGEGNGSESGDLAIASVVVNRANYGNPNEFGRGILGVINKGFDATGDPLFNSVSNPTKCKKLNPDNCLRYKNAVLAAIAAQTADGTNTDAIFYYDESIGMPGYISKGIKAGYIVPASVDGGSNRIGGTYGNPQDFYKFTDFNH